MFSRGHRLIFIPFSSAYCITAFFFPLYADTTSNRLSFLDLLHRNFYNMFCAHFIFLLRIIAQIRNAEINYRHSTNYSLYKLRRLSRAKLSVPKNNTFHGPLWIECNFLFRTWCQEVISRDFSLLLNIVRKYEYFFIIHDEKFIFNMLYFFT